MTVFHVQQTNEWPFVCSHCALLCTWHHLHIFNGVACGYGPFKLCLCGNHGSIYVLFQTYHIGVYQLFKETGKKAFHRFYYKIAITFLEIKYCIKCKMYAKSMERCKKLRIEF